MPTTARFDRLEPVVCFDERPVVFNAAEIEASLVSQECLGRQRVAFLVDLTSRVSAWRRAAQKARHTIDWKFRVHDARRVYRYGGIATARSEH